MLKVIVAVIGIGGITVGALLARYFERQRWERDARLNAYTQFLTASDAARRAITKQPYEAAVATRAQTALLDAWGPLTLLAHHPAHRFTTLVAGVRLGSQ